MVTAADLPPRYRPRDWTPAPDSRSGAGDTPGGTGFRRLRAGSWRSRLRRASRRSPNAKRCSCWKMRRQASGTILPPGGIDLRAHVAAIEESLIRQALDRSNGMVAQAARLLGLRRTTLVEKLRKFDIRAVDDRRRRRSR